MDRRIRYEVLRSTDDEEEGGVEGGVDNEGATTQEVAMPASMVLVAETESTQPPPPPPEASTPTVVTGAEGTTETPPQQNTEFKIPEPPSYNIATALPSYEEAERSKLEQEEQAAAEAAVVVPEDTNSSSDGTTSGSQRVDPLLGTDSMFLLTFMVSFVFNWLGLLASQCLSQSVAGRLGSMAGFGLSLVKWVAILKHNNWIHGVADADSWLWWLLILLGFLIFFRGCTQYIRIKNQWGRLSQNVRNNIFYYF